MKKVNNLKTETYKGYKIQFVKIGTNLYAQVSKGKENVNFNNNGYTKKEDLLNEIKNQIDSFNQTPNDISNPDDLPIFWIKGTNNVIRIRYDENGGYNSIENSNATILSLHHNRYNLSEELGITSNNFDDWEEMKKYIKKEFNPLIIRQISMYDHSGISLNVGSPIDRWDSGIVGFAIITKKSWNEIMGDTKFTIPKGERIIEQDIKEYSAYLEGNVYGWEIVNYKTEEIVDSFWGYIDSFRKTSEFNKYIVESAGYKMSEVKEI